MDSESESSSSDIEDEQLYLKNIEVKPFSSTRTFMTFFIPILPYFVVVLFILTLFVTNLRVNSCINRAFLRPPNSIVFQIDRRPKNVSKDYIPAVKYFHGKKHHSKTDVEVFFSQEDIREIANEIEEYNRKLPKKEEYYDKIEAVVSKYTNDPITAFDSYNYRNN